MRLTGSSLGKVGVVEGNGNGPDFTTYREEPATPEPGWTGSTAWGKPSPLHGLLGLSAPTHPSLQVPKDLGFGPRGPPTAKDISNLVMGTQHDMGQRVYPSEKTWHSMGRNLNPALLEPKDNPTAPTAADFSRQKTLGAQEWAKRPALGIFMGRPKPKGGGGLGSLGQWWNPISWAQTAYQGAKDVVSIANDVTNIANDVSEVAGEITTLSTDVVGALENGLMWFNSATGNWQSWLAMLQGTLYAYRSDFANFHNDFVAAMNNITNFLTGMGSNVEGALASLNVIGQTMTVQLSTVGTTLTTLVAGLDNLAQLQLNVFQQNQGQWAEYLSEFNQNAANLQSAQALIVDDLNALRDNQAILITAYTQFLNDYQTAYNSAPSLSMKAWAPPSLAGYRSRGWLEAGPNPGTRNPVSLGASDGWTTSDPRFHDAGVAPGSMSVAGLGESARDGWYDLSGRFRTLPSTPTDPGFRGLGYNIGTPGTTGQYGSAGDTGAYGAGTGVSETSSGQQAAKSNYTQQAQQQQAQAAAASSGGVPAIPPGYSAAYVNAIEQERQQLQQALNAQAAAAKAPQPPSSATPGYISQVQSSKPASSTVPGVAAKSYAASGASLPTGAITAMATGLAKMAKAADALTTIESTLVNLANYHATTQSEILANQKAQTAALMNIHNVLSAQNQMLASAPGGSGAS